MTRLLLLVVLVGTSACASHALWLKGRPPVLEDYTSVHVRIYRAGLECRLEVVTATESIVTLPTRCLTVPHVKRP